MFEKCKLPPLKNFITFDSYMIPIRIYKILQDDLGGRSKHSHNTNLR